MCMWVNVCERERKSGGRKRKRRECVEWKRVLSRNLVHFSYFPLN